MEDINISVSHESNMHGNGYLQGNSLKTMRTVCVTTTFVHIEKPRYISFYNHALLLGNFISSVYQPHFGL